MGAEAIAAVAVIVTIKVKTLRERKVPEGFLCGGKGATNGEENSSFCEVNKQQGKNLRIN